METLALYLYLQSLDGLTTYVGIMGGATEINPIASWVMGTLGLGVGIVVFKTLCGLGGLLIQKHFGRIPKLVNILGIVVVVFNLISIVVNGYILKGAK